MANTRLTNLRNINSGRSYQILQDFTYVSGTNNKELKKKDHYHYVMLVKGQITKNSKKDHNAVIAKITVK